MRGSKLACEYDPRKPCFEVATACHFPIVEGARPFSDTPGIACLPDVPCTGCVPAEPGSGTSSGLGVKADPPVGGPIPSADKPGVALVVGWPDCAMAVLIKSANANAAIKYFMSLLPREWPNATPRLWPSQTSLQRPPRLRASLPHIASPSRGNPPHYPFANPVFQ